MTYLATCGIALAATSLVCAVLIARRPGRRRHLLLVALTALVVGAFTAVFDSLMIAVGLFTYAPEHLLGARIGLAPIEDFGYVLLVALLLPTLWGRGAPRSGIARGDAAGEAP